MGPVKHAELTSREIEALQDAADGLEAEESAAKRGLAFQTVMTHRKTARRKLEARNTAHAVLLALRRGLIS